MNHENDEKLQQILNEVTSNTEALRRLLNKEEMFDSFVAHLVIGNLDNSTRVLFEAENEEEIPTWPSLKTYLDKRRKILSSIPAMKSKPSSIEMSNRSKDHVTNESHRTIVISCLLCKGSHFLMQCPEFLQMEVKQRHQVVTENKLCFNCLSKNHLSSNCSSKSKCKTCNMPHHTMLHFDKSIQSQSNAAPVSDLSSEVPPFVPYNMQRKTSLNASTFMAKRCTLLSTISINVIDKNGNSHIGRALLDSGSDTNFITTQFAKKLQLNLASVRMALQGISEKTTIIQHKTEAEVSSHYGPHRLNLAFSVMPTITGQLPSQTIDIRRLKIPQEIELADPHFHLSTKVDMLLNAEVFYESLLGEKFRLPEGPMMIHTKFGWIIGGEIKDLVACTASSMLSCFSRTTPTEKLNEKLDSFLRAEDVVSSKPDLTVEEKCYTIKQGVQMLSSAGMKLCKISSNCPDLLEKPPATDVECNENSSLIKTLGITYDVKRDQFSYQMKQQTDELITKTSVLSAIASIYDPIGWIDPMVLIDPEIAQEMKKTFLVTAVDKIFVSIETRFSNSRKIKNVFAYVNRFISNCRKNVNNRKFNHFTTEETADGEV